MPLVDGDSHCLQDSHGFLLSETVILYIYPSTSNFQIAVTPGPQLTDIIEKNSDFWFVQIFPSGMDRICVFI